MEDAVTVQIDLGVPDGLLGLAERGDREPELRLRSLGEGACPLERTAPDGDQSKGADLADGARVGRGLLAVAEDREAACFGTRQRIGGDGAGGGCADGGDLAGVRDADGLARRRVEEHDQALVRWLPLREVVLRHADELRSEGRVRAERAGHDTEQAPFGEREDRPEKLLRLTAGEGDHRVPHEGDADVVGEPPGDLVAIDEPHAGRLRCSGSAAHHVYGGVRSIQMTRRT